MANKTASKLFQTEDAGTISSGDVNIHEDKDKKQEPPIDDGLQNEAPAESEIGVDNSVAVMPGEIVDVDFNEIKKSRFRFNGDNSKILELNVRDLSISYRLNESYEKLQKLMDDVVSTLDKRGDEITDEEAIEALKKIDDAMKAELDYLFNADISGVFGSDGSMYDPIGGVFRYERIIEKLSSFYENNLSVEFGALKRRVEGRAAKYTKVKSGTSKYHN